MISQIRYNNYNNLAPLRSASVSQYSVLVENLPATSYSISCSSPRFVSGVDLMISVETVCKFISLLNGEIP